MNYADWTDWLTLLCVLLASLAGVGLTALTLPGTWLTAAVAAAVALLEPELIGWWVVGSLVALAVVGEIIEFFASAMGAAKFGASKRGAVGAVIGSIVGGIAGAPFLFPLGSIVGAVAGAAGGAILLERSGQRTWKESARAGQGAAIGRVLATVGKTGIAAVMGIVAVIAVIID